MSVSWGTQYAKLKTNLRLAANRLRLLQKKKTEQAMKARTEIAEFLETDKEDRARIRVESIIREDFVVEAYELLEMFCELLLARFGLIQQMKDLDDGIAEAVTSLLWVAPRITHEVPEFKIINDQLQQKYGKNFAETARMNQLPEPSCVSPKLVQKLGVQAPSKILVEKYLIEIARCANIDFKPDPKVMRDDDSEIDLAERNLVNFINEGQIGWSNDLSKSNFENTNPTNNPGNNFNYPPGNNFSGGGGFAAPPQYSSPAPNHIRPQISQLNKKNSIPNDLLNQNLNFIPQNQPYVQPNYNPQPTQFNQQQSFNPLSQHLPSYDELQTDKELKIPINPDGLPNAPSLNDKQHIYDTLPIDDDDKDFILKFPEPPKSIPILPKDPKPGNSNDELDFDNLARRFQELKKK